MRAILAFLRATATPSLLAIAVGAALLCAPAGAAGAVSPLPASDYNVRPACAAPTPGQAGCLALELVPQTTAARAHTHPLGRTRSTAITNVSAKEGSFGLRPQDLRSAYFPGSEPNAPASEPQTIALVDAYHDVGAEADLNVYDDEFSLPPCTVANKCFQQLNENGLAGPTPFPQNAEALKARETTCKNKTVEKKLREAACHEVEQAEGWTFEISTDIETAHAVCQNCQIILLEANTPEYSDLETAENTAARLGATEISNSWGGEELVSDSAAFEHPDTVITASSGDDGYLNWTRAKATNNKEYVGADYPASSPHVVAVGGTKLTLTPTGSRQSETVWNEHPGPEGAAGGGCSLHFIAPEWQLGVPDWSQVGCETRRAVADISADADPNTGVAVYDSTLDGATAPTWAIVGGTSVASPIIASMYALAGGAHGVAYPAATLYAHLGTASLQDITAGGNGECEGNYTGGCTGSITPVSPLDCGANVLICNAASGYDGPSGVGSPNGITAFQPDGTAVGGPNNGAGTPEKPAEPPQTVGETVAPPRRVFLPGTTAVPPSAVVPALSRLSLTPRATTALKRAHPNLSLVAFAFTLNVPARVRVTVARQIRSHGHLLWLALPGALTVSAARGRNSRRLHRHTRLPAGRYRLTLSPAHGTARSLSFHIR